MLLKHAVVALAINRLLSSAGLFTYFIYKNNDNTITLNEVKMYEQSNVPKSCV